MPRTYMAMTTPSSTSSGPTITPHKSLTICRKPASMPDASLPPMSDSQLAGLSQLGKLIDPPCSALVMNCSAAVLDRYGPATAFRGLDVAIVTDNCGGRRPAPRPVIGVCTTHHCDLLVSPAACGFGPGISSTHERGGSSRR